MKIKSLLLGSAAASMLAVSGAQAADPIIYAEPEAMEYVRICDVYGAGYYYIPGTETCLSINGYARYEIRFDNTWNSWRKYLEARVNFDARSETEWGTLRSYIRVQASDFNINRINGVNQLPVGGDFNAYMDQAFIQLGGLTMGYTESYFVDGKGSGDAYGTHGMDGLPYGYQQRMLIAYNFASNGFFGALSLEDDGAANTYMPDVVGRIGFGQAWGNVYGVFGYDQSDASWAGRIGTMLNVPNAPGSSFKLYGLYTSSPTNAYWATSRWAITGSYQHRFNPEFAAHIGAQYQESVVVGGAFTGNNRWAAQAGVIWTPVTNFEVRGEVTFGKTQGSPSDTTGRLRFTRTF